MTGRAFLVRQLAKVGLSWPAISWLKWRCRVYGVSVDRSGDAVELTQAGRVIRLAAKHAFFAPEVCRDFDAFAYAVPSTSRNEVSLCDFEAHPENLDVCRRLLKLGSRLEYRDGEAWLRRGHQAMILAEPHLMYAPYLTEHFDMYFSPLVPQQREGFEVLDYSRPGILQTYRSSGLQFEMASFPEEEEAIEDYFRWYRPKAGDVVFDIGAHCGVSTYHFAKLVEPDGKVICFEPDPVNHAILLRNIERHGLKNVVVEQVAIAGERGRLSFSSEGTIGSMLGSLLVRESAGKMVEVEAWTLADAYQRFGVPDLCKIDIEGAEIDVIAKSEKVLTEKKTNLTLDTCHLKPDGTPTANEVDALLRRYGYDVQTLAEPILTTWARP